jgi:hypothetical protein
MPTAFGARGCAFVVDDQTQCGAQLRAGSSYCEAHHALCHVQRGSKAERERLREVDRIGAMVGGRSHDHRGDRGMTAAFVRRLEAVQR